MKATERYGFLYPEDEDFADGSTQLAALATAIDEELQNRIDALNALSVPATYIRSRSTAVAFASSSQFAIITWNNDVYSSDGSNAVTTSALTVPTSGIYQAGMYCFFTPVGAANLNTIRNFQLTYTDRRGASIEDVIVMDWQQTTLEAATGVAVSLHAIFPVYTPNFNGAGLRGYVQHQNTSSNMQLNIGSYMWIHRLGDLVV